MPHFAFQDVKDELEADVNVRMGHAAGRDGGDVGREFGRADVLGRHSLFVMNAVPVPARAAAADGEDAVMIFHRARVDFILFVFHCAVNFALGKGSRQHFRPVAQGALGGTALFA